MKRINYPMRQLADFSRDEADQPIRRSAGGQGQHIRDKCGGLKRRLAEKRRETSQRIEFIFLSMSISWKLSRVTGNRETENSVKITQFLILQFLDGSESDRSENSNSG